MRCTFCRVASTVAMNGPLNGMVGKLLIDTSFR